VPTALGAVASCCLASCACTCCIAVRTMRGGSWIATRVRSAVRRARTRVSQLQLRCVSRQRSRAVTPPAPKNANECDKRLSSGRSPQRLLAVTRNGTGPTELQCCSPTPNGYQDSIRRGALLRKMTGLANKAGAL
jgi:hypothetical protein